MNNWLKKSTQPKKSIQKDPIAGEMTRITSKSNTILTYLLIVFCGVSFYLHRFITPYNAEYRNLLKKHANLKKQRNASYDKMVKFPENAELVKEYIAIKGETDLVWKNYKRVKKEHQFMGFKTLHDFVERFGLAFVIMIFALYNLVRTLYYDSKNYGSHN